VFTGLVEEVAVVESITQRDHSAHLRLRAKRVLEDVSVGDSISVNGVCLTVVSFDSWGFLVDAVPETMRRTNLGRLRTGDTVNLERALQVGDRLGGHIVSGHVDGVGVLERVQTEGLATVLTIAVGEDLLPYIANKGSICVNGVSLTVMDTTDTAFRVSIIPHTGEETTLLSAQPGAPLNLECDVLAKYVEKLLYGTKSGPGGVNHAQSSVRQRVPQQASKLNEDLLRRTGFISP
jgi:riboflavin synthase